MASFKKGVEVYLRDQYNSPIISDRRRRYKVRSCGKKQAVVDYIPEDGHPAYGRGQAYFITPVEEARSRYGDSVPRYIKTNWNEHFVLAGMDGWDAEEN